MVNKLNITQGTCYFHTKEVYSGTMYKVDIVEDLRKPHKEFVCEDCAKTKSFFFINNHSQVMYNKVKSVCSATIESEWK